MNRSGLLPSRITEKLVFFVGLMLLLGPGGVLFSNIRLLDRFLITRDILTLSPVGEILHPLKIVRRRGEDDLAFNSSRPGDPVFVGDTVITGRESSTKINLRDGSVLEVGPESMIKIEPVRSFSFKGIQKKFNVTVHSGQIRVKTETESAPIVFTSTAGAILGEIRPETPLPTPASPGETLKTAPTPDFLVIHAPPPPSLTEARESPAPLATAPIYGISTPPSNALSDASQAPSTLPLLTRDRLNQPETSRMISDFLSNLKPEPTEIKTESSAAETLEKPRLSEFVAPLHPIPDLEVTPLPATPLISEEADLKDQQFIFKWKDVGFRLKPPYRLKIEHNGKTSIFETEKHEYSWRLPLEAEGSILWWVEATLTNGEQIASKKQASQWVLPTPVLASPGNNLDLPEFYLKGDSHEVLLTWKQMQICKKFELQVSITETFENVIFRATTKKNFNTFAVKKPGKYFWRVGCHYTDQFKAFSKPFNFRLSRLN